MKEKIAYRTFFVLFIVFLCSMLSFKTVYVHAENEDKEESAQVDDSAINGGYDYTQYEELTQTFYIPKSSFMSSYDYEKYCERMYNYGYMDKDYNWTPAATNAINNMNASNMQKLDENAKQIVRERIDSGEMKAVDDPYLTYDQKQELIKKQEQESHQQSTGEGSEEGSLIDTETSVTPEAEISEEPAEENTVTKTPDEQQEQEEPESEENKTRSTIGWVVIILFFTIIAAIAYSIYRRQF